ncbi:MAG: choice-of-anchor D domain-containing protein [Planctomycetes bacterium]|nr:choice-of-anchor D domain-containing protein [Planctomycetota bacterium]
MRPFTALLVLSLFSGTLVAAEGTLTVTGTNPINFAWANGDPLPGPAVLTASNTGDQTVKLDWITAISGTLASRLSAVPSTGSIPAFGSPQTIQVYVDPVGLAVGNYTGLVRVVHKLNGGGNGNVISFNVNLAVTVPEGTLSVTGPNPIAFAYDAGGIPPDPVVLTLSNSGNQTVKLDWITAISGTLASRITAVPATGSIPPSGSPQTVEIQIDPIGLANGNYTGLVTITHQMNGGGNGNIFNFNVTLAVTKKSFAVGDTLLGSIDAEDDSDAAWFDGLKGMTLLLKIKPGDGIEKMRVCIVDEFDAVVKSWTLKGGETHNKQFDLEDSGFFALRFEGKKGTGDYKVLTDRKLPDRAKPRTFTKAEPKAGQSLVEFKIGALAGAIVNANVFPKGGLLLTDITVTLLDPTGAVVNITAYKVTSLVAVHLVKVPLTLNGDYTLRVEGLIIVGDMVTVPIAPFQPVLGIADVDLDA